MTIDELVKQLSDLEERLDATVDRLGQAIRRESDWSSEKVQDLQSQIDGERCNTHDLDRRLDRLENQVHNLERHTR